MTILVKTQYLNSPCIHSQKKYLIRALWLIKSKSSGLISTSFTFKLSCTFLTLFYTGFFLYVKIRGGVFLTPPWLKLEKWLKLGKRHFLAKIDYCCPLFMHLKLNYYHFWLKKGQKKLKAQGVRTEA